MAAVFKVSHTDMTISHERRGYILHVSFQVRRNFLQKPFCRFSLMSHVPDYYHVPVFKQNTGKSNEPPCLPWIRLIRTRLLELGQVFPSWEAHSLLEEGGEPKQNQG